eukprot:TRINITY_DN90664_c0_g1_i1.p1 TRINITY_DN90664_c0_g1~~TRINITY_DN90664_c0_g1_i1.p1  ORF type:complete len:199 (+),score=36.43 TRINITY_DN90664_c0_g1_i1:60-656(+)
MVGSHNRGAMLLAAVLTLQLRTSSADDFDNFLSSKAHSTPVQASFLEAKPTHASLLAGRKGKKRSHHHRSGMKEHLAYRHSLVANSAEEAKQIRKREKDIFAQGRYMRARKALYEKKLKACKDGVLCKSSVRAQQRKIEHMIAEGEAPLEVVQGRESKQVITDSAGREMRLMFSDGSKDSGAGVFSWFSNKVAWAFGI